MTSWEDSADVHDKWRERYGEKMFACPIRSCGSYDTEEWMLGWFPDEDVENGHYHDPNRRKCLKCGWVWWIPCPTCGHTEG